jgi:hypothetical protein
VLHGISYQRTEGRDDDGFCRSTAETNSEDWIDRGRVCRAILISRVLGFGFGFLLRTLAGGLDILSSVEVLSCSQVKSLKQDSATLAVLAYTQHILTHKAKFRTTAILSFHFPHSIPLNVDLVTAACLHRSGK